jgi:hypothetical protein
MDPKSDLRHHEREPHPMDRRMSPIPAIEAERQIREAQRQIREAQRRRRGRPAWARTAPATNETNLRELSARLRAPGAGAALRDVVDDLYASPIGRHGIRTVPSMVENVAAHREFFAEYPEQVSA